MQHEFHKLDERVHGHKVLDEDKELSLWEKWADEESPNTFAHLALAKELELVGERLHYQLLSGMGPKVGWATARLKDKVLMQRIDERPEIRTSSSSSRSAVDMGTQVLEQSFRDPVAERSLRLAAAEKRATESQKDRATMDDWRKDRLKVLPSHSVSESHSTPSLHKAVESASDVPKTVRSIAPGQSSQLVPSAVNSRSTSNALPNHERVPPRSRLACASPSCKFLVHQKEELGAYCCIACSESNAYDHGLRCQRMLAPNGCSKADPTKLFKLSGADLEDFELVEAIEKSKEDAAGHPVAPYQSSSFSDKAQEATQIAMRRMLGGCKTQEELDLEEAIRMSMDQSQGALPPIAGDMTEEEANLDRAIRLSLEATEQTAEVSADEDDEPPMLVPLEGVK